MDAQPFDETSSLSGERARLEHAHHELCTALTFLRSNMELVRLQLRQRAPQETDQLAEPLSEVDAAMDRLHDLARELRVWHAGAAGLRPHP